jgi:pSer/pThr/pTyr-binding forkhead associated (FHA) protein
VRDTRAQDVIGHYAAGACMRRTPQPFDSAVSVRAILMQVVLVMFRSDGERRSFSITRDVTVIGRREDCDFRIPLSDVSRKHCRLIKNSAEGALKVEDLGSSNGTYHNGQRVQEAELAAGDTLQVGPVIFVVQVDGVPADEEMQPVTIAPPAAAEGASAEAVTAGSNGEYVEQPAEEAAPDQISAEGPTVDADAAEMVEPLADGEFDPMSVLEGEDSVGGAPIADSAIGEDVLSQEDDQHVQQ